MLRLALLIVRAFGFLAPEALLPSLEVVILALVAFPSSIREHKSFLGIFKFFFANLNICLVIDLRIKILAKIWFERFCARDMSE